VVRAVMSVGEDASTAQLAEPAAPPPVVRPPVRPGAVLCAACGVEIIEDNSFCVECGAPVDTEDAAMVEGDDLLSSDEAAAIEMDDVAAGLLTIDEEPEPAPKADTAGAEPGAVETSEAADGPRFCRSCGAKLLSGNRFCVDCGAQS